MSRLRDVLGAHEPDPGPPRQSALVARLILERTRAGERSARLSAELAQARFQLSIAHQQIALLLAQQSLPLLRLPAKPAP